MIRHSVYVIIFFLIFQLSFPRNFIIPLPLYPSLELMVHSSAITVHRVGICWRKTCQLGEGGGIPASLSLLHNKHTHVLCSLSTNFSFLILWLSFPRNFIIPLPLYPSLEVTAHSSALTVTRVGICWKKTCQLGEGGGIPASLSLLHNKHAHVLCSLSTNFTLGNS